MLRRRRLRRGTARSGTRRDRALFGSMDSGIGAAETGSGRAEAGSVRREQAQFGCRIAGFRPGGVIDWSGATGAGKYGGWGGQNCPPYRLEPVLRGAKACASASFARGKSRLKAVPKGDPRAELPAPRCYAMIPLRTAYRISSGTLCRFSFCRMWVR
jgi:hypothetical protein